MTSFNCLQELRKYDIFLFMAKKLFDYAYQDKMRFHRNVWTLSLLIIGVFLTVTVLMTYVIYGVQVKSTSMEPSIKKGTCLFASSLLCSPKRGDIVLIKPFDEKPLTLPEKLVDNMVGFLTARKLFPLSYSSTVSGNYCIRRVMAIPGDTVYMQNYILYIKTEPKGQYLTEYEVINTPYETRIETSPAGWDIQMGVTGNMAELTLDEDEYFVLCDCRNSGIDSRMWGKINKKQLRAGILMSYFPLNRIKIY